MHTDKALKALKQMQKQWEHMTPEQRRTYHLDWYNAHPQRFNFADALAINDKITAILPDGTHIGIEAETDQQILQMEQANQFSLSCRGVNDLRYSAFGYHTFDELTSFLLEEYAILPESVIWISKQRYD